MAKPKILTFDWAFWFQWIMATTIGWLLGRFLLPNLAFIIIGIALGILQWLVLQHRIKHSWHWIVATSLGWGFGATFLLTIAPGMGEFLAGVIMGLTTGAAQWLILRQEVYWGGWWIAISVVGWTTGMALLPGVMLTGVLAGAVTGIAMMLLLASPRPPETNGERLE